MPALWTWQVKGFRAGGVLSQPAVLLVIGDAARLHSVDAATQLLADLSQPFAPGHYYLGPWDGQVLACDHDTAELLAAGIRSAIAFAQGLTA